MRRGALLVGIAALCVGGMGTPAWAEHSGPAAVFAGLAPAAAIDRIAGECEARGFGVRRMSDVDVICQGGELVRDNVAFRPSSPAEDPDLKPQVYHRFMAEALGDGSRVRERTTYTAFIGRRLASFDAGGMAAGMVNKRVVEFYAALGAVVAP